MHREIWWEILLLRDHTEDRNGFGSVIRVVMNGIYGSN